LKIIGRVPAVRQPTSEVGRALKVACSSLALIGKTSAAAALEGKFSTERLVAMAGDDNAQMALARSVSEKIEDAQRTWSKITVSRRMVEPGADHPAVAGA
jgi:hypothetical protein